MAYYLIIVFVVYFFALLLAWMGLDRVLRRDVSPGEKFSFISIVVAARNEEENILRLLKSLSQLNYPQHLYEIIIVNDHSEDRTQQIVENFFESKKGGRGISLRHERGKKSALSFGIRESRGEIIATTDADCEVPVNWLQRINRMFQERACQLCVGAVKMERTENFFMSLQRLEFASVIGTGAAALGWKKSIMCNGANLSFRKKAFENVGGYEGNLEYASGDDQFLMMKIIAQYPMGISFMPFKDSVVVTNPLPSWASFLHQRIRWAGKWKALSTFSKSLAVFAFVVQASWCALAFLVFSNPKLFLFLVLVKMAMEFFFLSKVHRFLSLPFQPFSFVALQFIYAPYVIVTAFFSQFMPFQWKGRSSVVD